MSLIAKIRTFFSGQSPEAFGFGQRHPLPKEMIKTIKAHVGSLRDVDMSAYTFERRHSDQKGSKSDLVIYDENQKVVLHGRESSGGPTGFWRPT